MKGQKVRKGFSRLAVFAMLAALYVDCALGQTSDSCDKTWPVTSPDTETESPTALLGLPDVKSVDGAVCLCQEQSGGGATTQAAESCSSSSASSQPASCPTSGRDCGNQRVVLSCIAMPPTCPGIVNAGNPEVTKLYLDREMCRALKLENKEYTWNEIYNKVKAPAVLPPSEAGNGAPFLDALTSQCLALHELKHCLSACQDRCMKTCADEENASWEKAKCFEAQKSKVSGICGFDITDQNVKTPPPPPPSNDPVVYALCSKTVQMYQHCFGNISTNHCVGQSKGITECKKDCLAPCINEPKAGPVEPPAQLQIKTQKCTLFVNYYCDQYFKQPKPKGCD